MATMSIEAVCEPPPCRGGTRRAPQRGLPRRPPLRSGGRGAAPDREGEIAAIRAIGLPRAAADGFADKNAAGNELVVVFAPSSRAQQATRILDAHGPVGKGVTAPAPSVSMPSNATPLSSALGRPVLAKTELPCEGSFGILPITGPGWFATGGLDFGRPNPAPFSSALGLPVLNGR